MCYNGAVSEPPFDERAIAAGERVLAAVSGGADSVALLLLLRERAASGMIDLRAAHYDHGLRGEASAEDARFVSALCSRLGIPLIADRGDAAAVAKARGIGLEQAAREARYSFLFDAMERSGSDIIAVAHHAEDQAETILMHLSRGCALRGACGMRARRGNVARPLLSARKADLIRYLRERGESWRDDATNAIPDNPRNRLRLEVLPRLEAIYPNAARAFQRFAGFAADDEEYLSELARAYAEANSRAFPGGSYIDLDNAPIPVARRAVAAMGAWDGEAIERALALPNHGSASMRGGVVAERIGSRLYFLRGRFDAPRPVPVAGEGTFGLMGIGAVDVREEAIPNSPSDRYAATLRLDSFDGLTLRTRRAGDRIRPLGMGGTKKLQDYLTDRKIDRPLRDFLALIARGSEVLWVAGVGASEAVRARAGESAVCLTFIGKRYV